MCEEVQQFLDVPYILLGECSFNVGVQVYRCEFLSIPGSSYFYHPQLFDTCLSGRILRENHPQGGKLLRLMN